MSEEIEIVQVWDDFRGHYYRPPSNPKLKHFRAKKVPKEIFLSYLHHREQMFHYYTLLREYFQPIREKKMRVAKNHERFNYETLEYEEIDQ